MVRTPDRKAEPIVTATAPATPEPPATAGVQRRIAEELGVREGQVSAAVELLDGGATVPFVARYRKEATGALDDAQLRTLEERLRYLRELDERRAAILESIRAQGKLDDELAARIMAADELDDLLRSRLRQDSVKDAVAHAVEVSGRPRREIYARALELAKELNAEGDDGED